MSQDYNETQPRKSNVALLVVLGGCGCFVVLFLACAILSFIFLPAFLQSMEESSRGASQRMECTNNMKQIGLALHNYYDVHNCLPPAYTVDEDGKPLHSWRVLMLPYVEQQHLYNQIRLDEPWDSEYNSQFHSYSIPTYSCPLADDAMTGTTAYSIVVGEETPFNGSEQRNFGNIADGTSNTIFLVERKTPVCWMDPTQEITFEEACKGINVFGNEMGSPHAGGMNVCLFDGSVQFVSEATHPGVLRALFTCSGGESTSF